MNFAKIVPNLLSTAQVNQEFLSLKKLSCAILASMGMLSTICNNTLQLYFTLGRAELHWNFFSLLRDAPDIDRFQTVHMVKTHFLLENL